MVVDYFPKKRYKSLKYDKLRKNSPKMYLLTRFKDSKKLFCIIFSSQTDLMRLSKATTWVCDGTFKSAPGMFYQIWSIHMLYRNRVLPMAFCLLPNKTAPTYKRALRLILAALDHNNGGF